MTTENDLPRRNTCHAVILHSNGDFVAESFADVEQLAQRLKSLIDHDVSVCCFSGERLHISKPPYRYLMAPTGNVPLYEIPENPEPDDTGYLGVDPSYLEGPPQVQMPSPQITQPDEFFADETNDISNIFDDALPDPDA